MTRSLRNAIEDILVAIGRLEEATEEMTFDQFNANWRAQYVVERGLMIISEASRAIPDGLKERHPQIR